LEAPGDYFVYVGGFGSVQLNDPFAPASGPGAGSEGTYDELFSIEESDVDFYSFDVEPGDVVGATVSGSAGRILLIDPEGKEVIGSSQDATFIAPEETELPGGDDDALFRLRRPPLEREPDAATATGTPPARLATSTSRSSTAATTPTRSARRTSAG
jgi:hypothetical protein